MAESETSVNEELERENAELRREVERLRRILGIDGASVAKGAVLKAQDHEMSVAQGHSRIDQSASPEAKIALYRSLFAGRTDVFALRWESERAQKSGWSPAVRGGAANAKKPDREYLPFTDEVLGDHLRGSRHVGLYPLLHGDTCRLLACDFDGDGWVLDALAYLRAATDEGVPATLERSQSGEGGHVWIFFEGVVPASLARRLGVHLLRRAMDDRSEVDLASYDRLFPTQDLMPKGSFGNLIALPLQGECRRRGTTVFLDPSTLEPYEDQWAHLAAIERMSPSKVQGMMASSPELHAGPGETSWRGSRELTIGADSMVPDVIHAAGGSMLAVERSGVPAPILTALKHLASLHNPEYYEKERLRFSTWNTPRFIRCYR